MTEKIKNSLQVLRSIVTAAILVFSFTAVFAQTPAGALLCPDGSFVEDAEADTCPEVDTNGANPGIYQCPDGTEVARNSDGTFDESQCGENFADIADSDCNVGPGQELDSSNCKIIEYLVTLINVLSAIAGMVIVASIMIAGFQYMTARDNSGQIEAARKRIVWAIVALLLFIFMYALLNFLVPGGVL